MKPLTEKKILFCRSQKSSKEFETVFRNAGADVTFFSTFKIEYQFPEAEKNARQYLPKLSDFDWILFSSVNGVDAFIYYVEILGINLYDFPEINIGIVGDKSGDKLQAVFSPIKIIFKAGSLQALVDKISRAQEKITVAHFTSEQSIDKIQVNKLDHVQLKRIPLYRTVKDDALEPGRKPLQPEEFDIIVFSSPTSFDYFREILDDAFPLHHSTIATFGKTTCEYIRQKGYDVQITPDQPQPKSLLDSVVNFFAKREEYHVFTN